MRCPQKWVSTGTTTSVPFQRTLHSCIDVLNVKINYHWRISVSGGRPRRHRRISPSTISIAAPNRNIACWAVHRSQAGGRPRQHEMLRSRTRSLPQHPDSTVWGSLPRRRLEYLCVGSPILNLNRPSSFFARTENGHVSASSVSSFSGRNHWSCQWKSLWVIFHSSLHLSKVNTSEARALAPASFPDQR
jgi:hypothetical protein